MNARIVVLFNIKKYSLSYYLICEIQDVLCRKIYVTWFVVTYGKQKIESRTHSLF